jgi:hypothetical protein
MIINLTYKRKEEEKNNDWHKERGA